ncbi:glycosyltransferase family 2 protein [[Eubacterium] cellulosolvens]
MECSTILLIYNEKDNIEPLTKNILKVYKDNGIAGEALLIDDGSEDGSAEICDRLAKKYKNVRVVHHPHNLGRSYAIQTGFKKSNSDVAIIMDGDYQYEPKEIPNFLKKVKAGYDVVSGNRVDRADDSIRRFISRTYNKWIIQKIFKLNVKDQNSGFKAFKKDVAKNMNFDPDGFLGLHRYILPLASVKGYSITEIPIKHYDRPAGNSYIKFYTVPFITLRDFFKFKDKYMHTPPPKLNKK